MTLERKISVATFIVGLIAYVATGRIARRSPHYGGGTVVLSWIGFFVPCIAWIAVYQGWTAVKRAVESHPSTESTDNKQTFTTWAIVYLVTVVVAGTFGAL